MEFAEAFMDLMAGKKIRNTNWKKDSYIYYDYDKGIIYDDFDDEWPLDVLTPLAKYERYEEPETKAPKSTPLSALEYDPDSVALRFNYQIDLYAYDRHHTFKVNCMPSTILKLNQSFMDGTKFYDGDFGLDMADVQYFTVKKLETK